MKGWVEKDIKDVIHKMETINPQKNPALTFEYIDVSSVCNKRFEIVETSTILGEDAPSRARRLVKKGDILFATIRPTLKRIAQVPEKLNGQVCSTGYFVLRPKDFMDARFLFYFLLTDTFMGKMERLQKGASYPAVTNSEVSSQKIPVPPIAQQKQIVAILDEAFEGIDAAITNTEKNLANARELFESYLNAIFTRKGDDWQEKELLKLVEPGCSLSYGIVQPGEEYDSGLPVVRPTDLTTKMIHLEGLKRIDPQNAASYQRTKLLGGELLLCVRGSTGTVSIAADELEGANVTRGIVPIRFKSSIVHQSFGYYMLISKVVQDQIKEQTYGAALMQINIRDLKKLTLPFPGLQEQENLAKVLNHVEQETQRLEAIYQQKLTALNELKQSILQKAFSGELTAEVSDAAGLGAKEAIAA